MLSPEKPCKKLGNPADGIFVSCAISLLQEQRLLFFLFI